MADDPTVQFSLRPTRECPICGHDMPPEENRCGLCGTTLLRDLLPPQVQNNSSASSAGPPAVEDLEPTLVTPLPPPPAPVQEEEGAKAISPSPPRSARAQKEISKAASPSPSPSRSPRVQKEAAKATPPSPPPPNPVPIAPSPEPPSRPTPAQPSAPPPIVPIQTTSFGGWKTLAAGALALFTVSFFAAKIFSSSQAEKQEAIPSPEISVERSGKKIMADGKKDVENKEAVAPSTPPVSPAPQLVGRVTTAEQLFPIRIFGADPNDAARGAAVFRAQVEASVQAIRDTYNAQIVENPQALGAAILELSVAPEGQVASAAVHITGSISRKLQQTIVDVVKVLRFAPIRGEEVKVFYPLFLSPEKVDPAILVSHVKDVWPGRYKVLAATPVRVRAEATESAQEVGAIGPGLLLSVVSSQNGWLGVLSPKGKVGYIRRDAIFPRVENVTSTDAKG
jgi:hypothetical protein